MRYIKLRVEVKAERVDSTVEVKTREGIEFAHEGDWIVTGGGGDHWPINHQTFIDRYEPLEQEGRFLARPIFVDAIRLSEPKSLAITWGQQSAKAGDWLVTNTDGSTHICDNEAFQRCYKLAENQDPNSI